MITKKSRYEISLMRTAGQVVAEVLAEMKNVVKPGVSTLELDQIAERIITKHGCVPVFKGYHGYPATICASINNEVVHGIPQVDRILQNGDIISVDVGASYKGLVGDSAVTIPVGQVSSELQMLMDVTDQALHDAIAKVINGYSLSEVSGAIEDRANANGLGIVKTYGGHGVGKNMHEDPFVFNYRIGRPEPTLKNGMTIAIEPMFNLGVGEVHTLSDNWTVVTNDGKASAHFEHTVLVDGDEPKILTIL